jgi:hypothetical protein
MNTLVDWLLAFGFWLLAFGFWLLAFGFWLLAFGFWGELHFIKTGFTIFNIYFKIITL